MALHYHNHWHDGEIAIRKEHFAFNKRRRWRGARRGWVRHFPFLQFERCSGLLRTCRQIYRETHRMFFHLNHFTFYDGDEVYIDYLRDLGPDILRCSRFKVPGSDCLDEDLVDEHYPGENDISVVGVDTSYGWSETGQAIKSDAVVKGRDVRREHRPLLRMLKQLGLAARYGEAQDGSFWSDCWVMDWPEVFDAEHVAGEFWASAEAHEGRQDAELLMGTSEEDAQRIESPFHDA
jgi:hypothetical protein